MKKLVVALLLFIPTLAFGQVTIFQDGQQLGTTSSGLVESTVANLPTAPPSGTVRIVTDGADASDCSVGLGSTYVDHCVWNGTDWVFAGGGVSAEVDTLDTVFDRTSGNKITGATESKPVQVCDTAGTTCWDIYVHSSSGPIIEANPAANSRQRIATDKTGGFYDVEGASDILTIDPDAASVNAMYTFAAAYRPRKSVWFGAGSLSTDGTQCAAPAEVIPVASGPKVWSIICTDNAASIIHGSVRMPDAWDGGTVTFTHVYQQTAADTGILNGDIVCQARSNGEAPSSTYSDPIAIDDAAVVGSGSNDMTTSAAITCAGTGLAGGDMLYFRYTLSTDTTTAVATLHHLGFNMEYSVSSLSD